MLESDTIVAQAVESTPVDTISTQRHNVPVAPLRSRDTGHDGRVAFDVLCVPCAAYPTALSKSVRLAPTAVGF